jgi:hypothetical protein
MTPYISPCRFNGANALKYESQPSKTPPLLDYRISDDDDRPVVWTCVIFWICSDFLTRTAGAMLLHYRGEKKYSFDYNPKINPRERTTLHSHHPN